MSLGRGETVGEHVWKTLGKLLMTCLQTVKTQSKHCLIKAVVSNLLNPGVMFYVHFW